MPPKGYVDAAPLVVAFQEDVLAAIQQSALSDEAAQVMTTGVTNLSNSENPEEGLPGSTEIVRVTGVAGFDKADRRLAKAILKGALANYKTGYEAEKKAGTSRNQAFERRAYLEPKESIAVLNTLAAADEDDLLREALKNTLGMTGKPKETQFEMSQSQLDSLPGTFGAKNKAIFPYGTYEIGILEIGMDKVQDMLDRSVNSFNEVIFQIFDDLTVLSKSLNGYVAGGLEDTNLAATAKAKATDIDEGTEEATGDDSAQLDFGFEE